MDKKYGKKEVAKYSDPKQWEIWPAPKHAEAIYQSFSEFTCLCPRSGYPDFAKIHLITVPNKKLVELKVLKMWFNSFRDVGISHENATHDILETLDKRLDLAYGFLLLEYTPRGNLHTFPMREFVHLDRYQGSKPSDRVQFKNALENARLLKEQVIKSVMKKYL